MSNAISKIHNNNMVILRLAQRQRLLAASKQPYHGLGNIWSAGRATDAAQIAR